MADDEPRDGTAAPAAGAATPRRAGVSRSVRRRMVVRQVAGRPVPASAPGEAATPPAGDAAVATLRPASAPDPGPAPDPGRAPDASEPAAATTDATAELDATAEPEPVARPARTAATGEDRAWRVASAVLVVLLLAGLVGLGLAGRAWWDQRQLDAAHQQALAAARQTTVNFMSISAKTVDRDLRRISDGATGDFKDEFTRDSAQVKSAVTQNKVDSRATVLRVALVSGDRRHAVVLVAVDATIHNVAAPDGRLLHYRVRVDLTHDGRTDRWLVSQLQFVG